MNKWVLGFTFLILSSCATTQPIPVTLNCPPVLHLPVLSEKQVVELAMFLSDRTYEILITREALLKQRIKTMCAIIESTH